MLHTSQAGLPDGVGKLFETPPETNTLPFTNVLADGDSRGVSIEPVALKLPEAERFCVEPPLNVPVAVYCKVAPGAIMLLAGVTAIVVNSAAIDAAPTPINNTLPMQTDSNCFFTVCVFIGFSIVVRLCLPLAMAVYHTGDPRLLQASGQVERIVY